MKPSSPILPLRLLSILSVSWGGIIFPIHVLPKVHVFPNHVRELKLRLHQQWLMSSVLFGNDSLLEAIRNNAPALKRVVITSPPLAILEYNAKNTGKKYSEVIVTALCYGLWLKKTGRLEPCREPLSRSSAHLQKNPRHVASANNRTGKRCLGLRREKETKFHTDVRKSIFSIPDFQNLRTTSTRNLSSITPAL